MSARVKGVSAALYNLMTPAGCVVCSRPHWWLYISPVAIDFFDLPAFVQDRATDKRLFG